jgi:hypothetical protein
MKVEGRRMKLDSALCGFGDGVENGLKLVVFLVEIWIPFILHPSSINLLPFSVRRYF